MKKNSLLYFLFLIISFSGFSQAPVQIGDGTINYYAPIDFRYDRSYSQVIYLGTEINGTGIITSISYYFNNTQVTPINQVTDVYIGNTTRNSFSYTQQSGEKADWEPIANLTKVVTAKRFITTGVAGWQTIVLDIPFVYDGTSNLVVALNTSFNGQIMTSQDPNRFYNTLNSGVRSLISQTNGGAAYNPVSPPGYASFSGNTPNIKFGGLTQTCETPKGLKVSNITTNSSTVTWDAPFSVPSNGTDYYVSTSSTLPDQYTIPTGSVTSAQTFNAINLNSGTYYYVWVRNNCGDGNVSAWSVSVRFLTVCAPVTSFYENCEGETVNVSIYDKLPKCWSRILRGGDDLGSVFKANITLNNDKSGTIMHDNNSFSMGNGDSNVSILSKADIILITPELASLALTNYRLKFWTRSAYGAIIEIGTITNTDPATAVFTKFTSLKLDPSDPIKENTIDLIGLIGNHKYIAFRMASTYQFSGLFIDDVLLELTPTCQDVSKIKINTTTSTSVNLSWEDLYSSGKYQVVYGLETATDPNVLSPLPSTTTLSQNINGLSPNTTYKVWVRSICDGTRNGAWIGPIKFTTPCTPINSLNEKFDSVTAPSLPTCWGKIIRGETNSDFAWVQTANNSAVFSSPNAVQIYSAGTHSSATDLILFTPQLELSTLTSGKYRLVFYTKLTYEVQDAKIEIGTLNSQSKTAVFTKYRDFALTTQMTKYILEFDFYTGTDLIIGFRVNNQDGNTGMVYIDDVKWELIPVCNEIDEVNVSTITPQSAIISWVPKGEENNWQVVYTSDTNENPDLINPIDTNEISLTLNGLNDNTAYKVWVRAKCDANSYSTWSSPISFTTKCAPIASFDEDFKNVTSPNLPQCWSKILRGESLSSFAYIKSNQYKDTPELGLTAYSVTIYNGGSSVDDDIILVSPNLSTLSLGTYRLRINGKGDATSFIDIGTLNTNDNSAVFTLVETISLQKNSKEYIIDFGSYSGTDTYIGIKTNNATLSWFDMSNIVWEITPDCPDTNNINTVLTNTNSGTFSWDINGATKWQAAKGLESDTDPNNLTPIDNIILPYLELNGLSPNTTYKLWVRSDCDNGIYGKWSVAEIFKTQCNATNVPYIQDFESSVVPSLPSCTTEVNLGVIKTWKTGKYEAWENNHGFTTKTLKYSEDGQNAANTWFFTQGINLESGKNYTISYIYGGASTDPYFVNDLKIMYGTEATPSSMNLPIADHKQFALDGPVSESTSFSPTNSGVYYFGFNAYSKRNSYNIFVDDIKIDTALSSNEFDLSKFNYYPNPVKDVLNISYIDNITAVSVYNILGQEVVTKTVNGNLAKVDMSALAKGTYMVKITSNQLAKTIKVIKE